MKNKIYVNLGCGDCFLKTSEWINFDYTSHEDGVVGVDLLNRLPLPDNSVDLIYTSHFIEHIPYDQVNKFLSECRRILKPGGVIRIVTPDLVEMSREYLKKYDMGDYEKSLFLSVAMIDQCVRKKSGGELANLYNKYSSINISDNKMIDYIKLRTGEDLSKKIFNNRANKIYSYAPHKKLFIKKLFAYTIHKLNLFKDRVKLLWFQWLVNRLPVAYKNQNMSFASIGELHHWLWDQKQLISALEESGFEKGKRYSHISSQISDFPFYPLDTSDNIHPRKGYESMFIEAEKPINL